MSEESEMIERDEALSRKIVKEVHGSHRVRFILPKEKSRQ